MIRSASNPYKGPFPFTSGDENLFFGRKAETEELISLIRDNQLTVLFGASGTGKTSLIHAKLLPQLTREYFHPIYIRINFANKNEDPLEYVQSRIVEELRKWDSQVPDYKPSQTLVDYAAKNVIYKGLIKPVLFFDQFEEIFTLGPQNDPVKVSRLIHQISDLIELRLPDDLKDSISIKNITSFKVVFSLRQDWVGYLDDYSYLMPSILENRYRLKKFSYSQAMEAIVGSNSDQVSIDAAKEIVRDIGTPALFRGKIDMSLESKELSIQNKEVDPFVLSIYCYQLFEKAHKNQNTLITSQFVSDNHNAPLIRNYYDENMMAYGQTKILIETKLLNDSGKRLMISLSSFAGQSEEVINTVEQIASETGILRILGVEERREVEIVHDRLAHEIFESRREREQLELNKESIARNQEANELKLLAEQKEKEADSLRKRAEVAKKIIFITVGCAAILVTSTLAWALNKSQKIVEVAKKEVRDNYTYIGLKEQLDEKSFALDSLLKRDSLKQMEITSGPFQNEVKINSAVVKIKDSLDYANRKISALLIANDQISAELNRERLISDEFRHRTASSETIVSSPGTSETVENTLLKPANIQISEFRPIGGKMNSAYYAMNEIKAGLSLRLKIINFPSNTSQDSIFVKIFCPISGNEEPKLFGDSFPVSRPRPLFVWKDRRFTKGIYKYQVFNNSNILREGGFEVR